jgi:chitodextrinase
VWNAASTCTIRRVCAALALVATVSTTIVPGAVGAVRKSLKAPSVPKAPSGVTVIQTTAVSLSLTWQRAKDRRVTGYDVYLDGRQVATTRERSYTFSNLACGRSYTVGVGSFDAAGIRSAVRSVVASTRPCPDTSPPTPPSGLTQAASTQSSISLFWAPSVDNVGVVGYDLFRDAVAVGTTQSTSHTFSGLACGRSYTLGVQSRDAAGNHSTHSSVQASTAPCPDTIPPTTPGYLIQTASTEVSITLSWTASIDNVGVVGYRLHVNGAPIGSTSLLTYTAASLACGMSYTLAVVAYDAAGNGSSPASIIASTRPCAPPPPPSATLKYSVSTDRSGSNLLAGSTFSGPVCVFLVPDSTTGPVNFYLDGAFHRAENFAPWDFNGGVPATCYPYTFAKGTHTIKATYSGGQASSSFTAVAPPPPPPPPITPPPPPSCTRTLMPGNDVGSALNSLSPGQTACLTSGNYAGNFPIRVSGVTLTAASGASPAVNGYIEIKDTANDVTISSLKINGASTPQNTLQVWGDRFKLVNSEIDGGHSSTMQSCIYLGHVTFGVAYDAVIDHNRLHDCGTPATPEGHGFYMDAVRGNTQITNNYIYDNDGFGMQLYKDGDNARIEHNVFDGAVLKAGIYFGGEAPNMSSDNNTVRYNIFTFNNTFGLDAGWGGPIGVGNVASNNCFSGNGLGSFGLRTGWMDLGGNVFADPLYVDRAGKDFRLRAGSPCAAMGPR